MNFRTKLEQGLLGSWWRTGVTLSLVVVIAIGMFPVIRSAMVQITARRSTTTDALASRAPLIVEGALAEVENRTRYKEEYRALEYPGGDVPANTGVCTDLIVRAFRNAGVDLQKEFHEDRLAHPEAYPTDLWDHKAPDPNIDHRRCQNLAVWFDRFAESLPTRWRTETERSWQPGDVVFYASRGSDHPSHVAIVSNKKTRGGVPFRIELTPPKSIEALPLTSGRRIHSHYRLVAAIR